MRKLSESPKDFAENRNKAEQLLVFVRALSAAPNTASREEPTSNPAFRLQCPDPALRGLLWILPLPRTPPSSWQEQRKLRLSLREKGVGHGEPLRETEQRDSLPKGKGCGGGRGRRTERKGGERCRDLWLRFNFKLILVEALGKALAFSCLCLWIFWVYQPCSLQKTAHSNYSTIT